MNSSRRCETEKYLFLFLKGERSAIDEDKACLPMLMSSEVIFLDIDTEQRFLSSVCSLCARWERILA